VTSDTTFTVSFSLIDGGLYSVSVIPLSSRNVCMNNMSKRNFVYTASPMLGVNDIEGANGTLDIFPNPANSSVSLELKSLAQGTYNVQVLNMNGQKLYDQSVRYSVNGTRLNVPTANFPNGVYFIKVAGDNYNHTEKLLIQH